MSSQERHRGTHPADKELFAPATHASLRLAVRDLSWLLGHGYARTSALKLVGDRHELRERQRLAVARAACADKTRDTRRQNQLPADTLQSRHVMVDGFNLLVSLEAAYGGGVLLLCRDGCVRDMSSVHGTYHAVAETERAILAVGERLMEMGVASSHWLLDSPVSNSGRLAQHIREIATQHGWPWTVEAVFNPDATLIAAPESAVVVSSDSMVIDGASCWFNLAADLILNDSSCEARIVDLR